MYYIYLLSVWFSIYEVNILHIWVNSLKGTGERIFKVIMLCN
jgi:hypothetical protein